MPMSDEILGFLTGDKAVRPGMTIPLKQLFHISDILDNIKAVFNSTDVVEGEDEEKVNDDE
jgi:hypothetical protein